LLRLDAPVVWWTLPGRRYRYGCHDGEPWEQRWIAFKGPRAEGYVASGLLPDVEPPLARPADPGGYVEAFDRLLRLLFTPGFPRVRAVHELEGLLLRAAAPGAYPAPRLEGPLERLMERLREAPERSWDFHQEAKRLGMSYSRFRQRFKALARRAPLDYLIERRLDKAAELLRGQALSVAEAGARAGFEDASYFFRQFRRRFESGPQAYKTSFAYPPAGVSRS